MRNIVDNYVDRSQAERKERLQLGGIILLLALVVAGIVFWRLHYTGVAMTNDVYCGLEEHVHDDSCYETTLVCGMEEDEAVEGHVHDASCYETITVLVCGLEESEGHVHTETCYDEEGELICGMEDRAGHAHTDECYGMETVLVCGLEETEGTEGHIHTADCYEQVLVCDIPEHVHTIECLVDEEADVETEKDWEATLPEELTGIWAEDVVAVAHSQLGYTESERNFVLAEDGQTRNGYSRYGAWYGNTYGSWDAMFVSFCLHYAGIPEETMPEASGVFAWILALQGSDLYADAASYTPVSGDLVFLDNDGDGTADRVGIVERLGTDLDAATGEEVIIRLYAIEGDYDDAVVENVYVMDDAERGQDGLDGSCIVGYGILPEEQDDAGHDEEGVVQDDAIEIGAKNMTTITFEGADVTVTVSYGPEAGLPEGVQLVVSEYAQDSDVYQARYEEAADIYDWEEDLRDSVRLFDISLSADGIEVEPTAPVQVTITYPVADALETVSLTGAQEDTDMMSTVIHFGEETEEVESETVYDGNSETVTFDVDGFSDIMVVSIVVGNADPEDWDETTQRTVSSITIQKVWDDEEDKDKVRPTSVTFNLIDRRFYDSVDDHSGGGELKQDKNGLWYDPDEDVIVQTVVMVHNTGHEGFDNVDVSENGSIWTTTFTFDPEVTYDVFEEETYGASFYTHTKTAETPEGDTITYTITNTVNSDYVIFDTTGQGGTDGSAVDQHYKDGHYYHIDVRVDADYTYTYYGDEIILVDGTDITVTKTWETVDGDSIPDQVTFYVLQVNDDGTTSPLYRDSDGLQTTTVTTDPITITLTRAGGWTASIALDGGNYALEEETLDGYSSELAYVTIDEKTGEQDANDHYIHVGSVKVDAVNWVMYELRDNADTAYFYYDSNYADYTYGRIDGSFYTSPEEAHSDSTGDYEFFLDNGDGSAGSGNQYGLRGLYYLTKDSTIWVNLDYTYSYVDENGDEQSVSVFGYSFEFTPEEWQGKNLCPEIDKTSSMRGIDLYIDGQTLMSLALRDATRTELEVGAKNTSDSVGDTVYLQGTKTWLDAYGAPETGHVSAEEVDLIVSRSSDDGATWSTLEEGTDYVVTWAGDLYYIYASGEDSVYSGLPRYDEDEVEYRYKVEEQPIEGYAATTQEVTNSPSSEDDSDLYGTSYNFTNTAINDRTLTIQKVDSNGDGLDGAVFTLKLEYMASGDSGGDRTYYYTGDEDDPWSEETTGDGSTIPTFMLGSVTLTSLHNGTYTLTETDAPDGYNQLSSPITFTVEDGIVNIEEDAGLAVDLSEDGLTLTITNFTSSELPSTGGMGTYPYTIGGALLIACCASALVYNKNRRKGESDH